MEKEILINPYTVIRLFANTYKIIGNIIFTDRKYKVTREAWICAMYLIALSKSTKNNWWLTPVLDDSGSPDFNCYSFKYDEIKKGSIRDHKKVEVFEWRNEVKESSFVPALKKIKLDKIIDTQITILSYIRRDVLLPPINIINKEIQMLKPKVLDIWYLADVDPNSIIWQVAQVYPNMSAIDINYDEILNTREPQSFISCYRSRSESFAYENTDEQVILTDEFNMTIVNKSSK